MPGVTKDLTVLSPPRSLPLDIELGQCAVALTSSPFIYPPPGANCFAFLGDWLPCEAPVGMLVTFRAYVPQGRTEQAQEVHSVYASDGMRGRRNVNGDTIPVVIGRWLFESRLLTLHSPDRTDAGDVWARAVGGELPDRDQVGTEENAVASGQGALDLLNRQAWPRSPWAPFA